MFFSIIIPLYNRPIEIKELLESLTQQTYQNFEVIVVEDGSTLGAQNIVESFSNKLNVKYFFKENSGQGFSRNFGFEKAEGTYFIIFDSDCLIPNNYLEIVNKEIESKHLDAYGGPDAAHHNFSAIQKAISYAMTSVFTTGGIRGKKNNAGGQFHPRSFNMGLSKKVFEKVGGFKITRMGEDILYSIAIIEAGFKVALIPEAHVYHKRRTNFKQFWKQLFFFGRARINISKFYPKELKLVHFFPAVFCLFLLITLTANIANIPFAKTGNFLLSVYILLIFFDAWWKNKSVKVAFLSIFASLIQLSAYGCGFIKEILSNKFLTKLT